MRYMQGALTLGEALIFLYRDSTLVTPHCTNVLALINNIPALLPMLAGTEYRLDCEGAACDFLVCVSISDLKSLDKSLRGSSQYDDKFITEICRACSLCAESVEVVNTFDHIWFECDAEPSGSLSIFLGIDSVGGLWSIEKELMKITTALNLLESLYGVTGDRLKLYNIASSLIERLGRGIIYEVGFMARAKEEAHVKLLIANNNSCTQAHFLEISRSLSDEIDDILSRQDISPLIELMITSECTAQISVSVYADRQRYAIEFKPPYDPWKRDEFDFLWSQVRDFLKLGTNIEWLNISVAESQPKGEGINITSRLHHIKLFSKDSSNLGIKVYRDFRVSSAY